MVTCPSLNWAWFYTLTNNGSFLVISIFLFQFIQWSKMHAQQSFLNACNTAILGYHGDKITFCKNVNNIKYVKNHRLFNYQICQDHRIFDYKICQDHRIFDYKICQDHRIFDYKICQDHRIFDFKICQLICILFWPNIHHLKIYSLIFDRNGYWMIKRLETRRI